MEEPPEGAESLDFDASGLNTVRRLVARNAAGRGLPAERSDGLVLTMHEIAANSVRHGGGRGVLRIWREPDGLVCEVRDSGSSDQCTPVLICATRVASVSLPSSNQDTSSGPVR